MLSLMVLDSFEEQLNGNIFVRKSSAFLSKSCKCGAEEQIADHIITFCPNFHHPSRGLGLEAVDEETVAWLNNTCPTSKKSFKMASTPYKKEDPQTEIFI